MEGDSAPTSPAAASSKGAQTSRDAFQATSRSGGTARGPTGRGEGEEGERGGGAAPTSGGDGASGPRSAPSSPGPHPRASSEGGEGSRRGSTEAGEPQSSRQGDAEGGNCGETEGPSAGPAELAACTARTGSAPRQDSPPTSPPEARSRAPTADSPWRDSGGSNVRPDARSPSVGASPLGGGLPAPPGFEVASPPTPSSSGVPHTPLRGPPTPPEAPLPRVPEPWKPSDAPRRSDWAKAARSPPNLDGLEAEQLLGREEVERIVRKCLQGLEGGGPTRWVAQAGGRGGEGVARAPGPAEPPTAAPSTASATPRPALVASVAADRVLAALAALKRPYKYTCATLCLERAGAGAQASLRAVWNPSTDGAVSIPWRPVDDLEAVTTVLFIAC